MKRWRTPITSWMKSYFWRYREMDLCVKAIVCGKFVLEQIEIRKWMSFVSWFLFLNFLFTIFKDFLISRRTYSGYVIEVDYSAEKNSRVSLIRVLYLHPLGELLLSLLDAGLVPGLTEEVLCQSTQVCLPTRFVFLLFFLKNFIKGTEHQPDIFLQKKVE